MNEKKRFYIQEAIIFSIFGILIFAIWIHSVLKGVELRYVIADQYSENTVSHLSWIWLRMPLLVGIIGDLILFALGYVRGKKYLKDWNIKNTILLFGVAILSSLAGVALAFLMTLIICSF